MIDRFTIPRLLRNMMTEMMKDWLWRQVWRNAGMPEKYSHLCDGYEVEQLDPKRFSFIKWKTHLGKPTFTVYHFVTHMVIMRNALPWERYRRHRQWIFTEQRQYVPTFQQLLVAFICGFSSKPVQSQIVCGGVWDPFVLHEMCSFKFLT